MSVNGKSIGKLFLDFESYYSDDYTLKKLTPFEYVLDPRFEALGCAFCWDDKDPFWVDGPDLPKFFTGINWKQTMAISHNALFDMVILSFKYQIKPALYGDTLSMATNLLRHATGRVSLDACCNYYGLPTKTDTILKMKGVNFAALKADPYLYPRAVEYACADVTKCRQLYRNMMRDGFPPSQLEIVDMVIRMATWPQLQLDEFMLAEHLADIKAKKQALLDAVGLENRDNLMRDAALAAMLINANVTPPMKQSKTDPLKKIFAFAKTDKAFTDLLEHDDPDVQALVAARLGHKSTLEETRTQRLIDIQRISPSEMPIPLRYSGAHTHRFSGDWSINMQNLPRSGRLRRAIKAPQGWKVVSVDSSQIEARLNAVLSGQDDLVQAFANGEDVYSSFAEQIYHVKVTKEAKPTERFVGKTGILSLGYGSSPPVFQNMCRVQSMGMVKLSDHAAAAIVSIYRQTYRRIVDNWGWASRVVLPILAGEPPMHEDHLQWGPVRLEPFAIVLPNGNKLYYRDLRRVQGDEGRWQWQFMRGPIPVRTYGAKIVENVIQALAFVHIMEVALRVKHFTNSMLMPVHQVHDELLYMVPAGAARQTAAYVRGEMSKSPWWMPHAPLAAEAKIGDSYGSAK